MRFFKYFPLVIFGAVLLMTVGCIVVMGWNFGIIKAKEWIVSVCIAFSVAAVFYEAVKIVTIAAYQELIKKEVIIDDHGDFEFETDSIAASNLLTLREHCNRLYFMLRKSLYEPMSLQEQERIRKKIQMEHKLEAILSDLSLFLAFLLTLTVLIISTSHFLSFYSSRHIRDIFVTAKFSVISFKDIHDDRDLMFYLQNVFIPSVHCEKSSKGETFDDGNGWITERFVRMLGVPRLRQARSQKIQCGDLTCIPEYSEYSKVITDFQIGWKVKKMPKHEKKFWRIQEPWKFSTDWKLKTLFHFGTIANYPGSGYASNLGRTSNNSFTILEFLNDKNWIDRQTKALFVEATFYSVDSGILNIVTLALERTPFGNWIGSNVVHTSIFLLSLSDFRIFLPFLCFSVVLLILISSARKITSLSLLMQLWNIVDIFIIILSIALIASVIMRNYHVGHLVNQLKASRNNEFVSFHLVAFHDGATKVAAGFLISIATVRLWKILNFSARFRALKMTFFHAAHSLFIIGFLLNIFLIGFSTTVYIINGSQSELFSTFMRTFTSLLAQSLGFNRNIHLDDFMYGGRLIGISVCGFLTFFVKILLLNMLTTIVCIYVKKVKDEMKKEPKASSILWKVIRKKIRKITGKPPKDELKFFHQNFTLDRACHIKTTIDAHIELLSKYLEESRKI